MRNIALIPLLFIIIVFNSWAQEGYKYVDISAGYLIKNTYVGEISIDFGKRYHNATEIYIDGTYNETSEHKNYKFGLAYKPLIARSKNTALNFRFTGAIGTNEKIFIAGISGGLELNFNLKNGMIIFFRQKTEFTFWEGDHWKSGLLTGLKFPFN